MTGVIYHLCRFPGAMQLRARAKGTSISNFKKPTAKPSNGIFYFLLSSLNNIPFLETFILESLKFQMISKPEFIEETKTLEQPQMLGKEAWTMKTFMSKLELVH